jgi:fumarate reductase (CoM/CoB) subunit A
MKPEHECDVLIIGGGGAGIMSAIYAARKGADVILLEKGVFGRAGCTILGAHSINAALGHMDSEDSPEIHAEDTLRKGRYLNDPRLVEIYTQEAPDRVKELVEFGVRFDMREGNFDLDKMPGSTHPRACHAKFQTGRMMMAGLRRELKRYPNITVHDEIVVTKLFRAEGRVVGAKGIQLINSQPQHYLSRAIVLATGGAGQLYANTTTSIDNTGDGMILALEAGATLRDLEFVQFLPLVIQYPHLPGMNPGTPSMLSRLADARLTNRLGERFAERAVPNWRYKATRDALAQLMYREIQEKRSGPHNGLFLSVSHLPPREIEKRFKYGNLFQRFLALGVDLRSDALEVAPAAHYHMGGILIDEHGQTTIPGLFAAGEVTGGVDGSNRLGGNALSEILVFGARAGAAAATYAADHSADAMFAIERDVDLPLPGTTEYEGLRPATIKSRIQKMMWEGCGVVRDRPGLEKTRKSLLALQNETRASHVRFSPITVYNREILDFLEVEKMLVLARIIVEAALMRTESRGAHYRADYPETNNDHWLANLLVHKDREEYVVQRRPAQMAPSMNGEIS